MGRLPTKISRGRGHKEINKMNGAHPSGLGGRKTMWGALQTSRQLLPDQPFKHDFRTWQNLRGPLLHLGLL